MENLLFWRLAGGGHQITKADNNDLMSNGSLLFWKCREDRDILIDYKNTVWICIAYRHPFSAAGSLDQDVLTHHAGPSSDDGTNFFFISWLRFKIMSWNMPIVIPFRTVGRMLTSTYIHTEETARSIASLGLCHWWKKVRI